MVRHLAQGFQVHTLERFGDFLRIASIFITNMPSGDVESLLAVSRLEIPIAIPALLPFHPVSRDRNNPGQGAYRVKCRHEADHLPLDSREHPSQSLSAYAIYILHPYDATFKVGA